MFKITMAIVLLATIVFGFVFLTSMPLSQKSENSFVACMASYVVGMSMFVAYAWKKRNVKKVRG